MLLTSIFTDIFVYNAVKTLSSNVGCGVSGALTQNNLGFQLLVFIIRAHEGSRRTPSRAERVVGQATIIFFTINVQQTRI